MKLKLKKIDGLVFEEASHTYTLNGKLLPGVTTILAAKDKPFLSFWRLKIGVETIGKLWEAGKAYAEEEIKTILEAGKKAHSVKSKEALVSGKIAHAWIEKFVKAKIAGENFAEKIEDEKAKNAVSLFYEWQKEHKIEWLASELKLASPKYEFAGTIDAVAKIDGRLTIVDFKTSNQISDEYWLQTGAYQLLLDDNLEDTEERPVDRLIIRIPKTGDTIETKVAVIPLDLCVKTFLALREVRKFDSWIENNK